LANIIQAIILACLVCLASLHVSMVNYLSQTLWSPQPIISPGNLLVKFTLSTSLQKQKIESKL